MMDARLVSLAEPHKRALVVGADDEEGRWVIVCLYYFGCWLGTRTQAWHASSPPTLTLLNPPTP